MLLTNLAPKYEYLQLDNAAIERRLLAEPESRSVAARFMPKSFNGWIRASQRAANESPVPDPHRSFDIYFMREPHSVLDAAMAEAQARNLPVFAVVYDAGHPQQSNTGAECLVSRSTH